MKITLGHASTKDLYYFQNKYDDYVSIRPDEGIYNVIIIDNQFIAGLIGFVFRIDKYNGEAKELYFLQDVLEPEYRGKGILKHAFTKFMKLRNFREVQATINKGNIASIKAHTKIGFTKVPEDRERFYRSEGSLLPDTDRYIYIKHKSTCTRYRHRWTDGWICDYCGKKRADIEEIRKKENENECKT